MRAFCWWIALAVLTEGGPFLEIRGRWILGRNGEPHYYSCDTLRFGLQPSGLAWDGERLWAVGDQSSSCPGCLFWLDPAAEGPNPNALFLEEDGLPVVHQGRKLAVDGEGITLLDSSTQELVFAVVLEDRFERHIGWATDDRSPGAALVEPLGLPRKYRWTYDLP